MLLQDPGIRSKASRWYMHRLGFTDTSKGFTNNRSESNNAAYNRLRDKGLHAMPEGMISVYTMQRDQYREVTRAYYGLGNLQLKPEHNRLLRDASTIPSFDDRTFEEAKNQILELSNYRRGSKPDKESPTKSSLEHDPVKLQVEEVIRQVQWYDQNKDAWDYNKETRSFLVAKYQGSLKTDHAFQVRVAPESCSCPDAPACAHLTFIKQEYFNILPSPDELYDQLERREKKKGKSIRGPKKDYGRKAPLPDSHKDPMFGGKLSRCECYKNYLPYFFE